MIMMKVSKTPFCCSKFPWKSGRISQKIIDNLGTRSEKVSPALHYAKSKQLSYCEVDSRLLCQKFPGAYSPQRIITVFKTARRRTYTEPYESIRHFHAIFNTHFNIIIPVRSRHFKTFFISGVLNKILCRLHFLSRSDMLHAQLTSFYLI
jgi:hypothetical protein